MNTTESTLIATLDDREPPRATKVLLLGRPESRIVLRRLRPMWVPLGVALAGPDWIDDESLDCASCSPEDLDGVDVLVVGPIEDEAGPRIDAAIRAALDRDVETFVAIDAASALTRLGLDAAVDDRVELVGSFAEAIFYATHGPDLADGMLVEMDALPDPSPIDDGSRARTP